MPSIRLNLITTQGRRLCVLEVGLQHFDDKGIGPNPNDMLNHLSSLLPAHHAFAAGEAARLKPELTRLREDRRPTTVTVNVAERPASIPKKVESEPGPSPAELTRLRAERDQARAELRDEKQARQACERRLAEAERLKARLSQRSAELEAQQVQSSQEVARLRAEVEAYSLKWHQAAADVQRFRDRLRECQRRLAQFSPPLSEESDIYG